MSARPHTRPAPQPVPVPEFTQLGFGRVLLEHLGSFCPAGPRQAATRAAAAPTSAALASPAS